MDKKKINKLMLDWKKANAAWKTAAKNSQEAIAAYHWTTADDGAKWNKVVTLGKWNTAACEKADAAWKELQAALRPR